jgi:hypothetical protein
VTGAGSCLVAGCTPGQCSNFSSNPQGATGVLAASKACRLEMDAATIPRLWSCRLHHVPLFNTCAYSVCLQALRQAEVKLSTALEEARKSNEAAQAAAAAAAMRWGGSVSVVNRCLLQHVSCLSAANAFPSSYCAAHPPSAGSKTYARAACMLKAQALCVVVCCLQCQGRDCQAGGFCRG